MNNDEAFLNLLSSQRQLLTQLNRESAANRLAESEMKLSGGCMNGDLPVAPNQSICEPMNHNGVVFSKRLSTGLGNDIFCYPAGLAADEYKVGYGTSNSFDIVPKSYKKDKDNLGLHDFEVGKKRHLSSIGFLNSLFAEDMRQQRRLSLLPNHSFQPFPDNMPDSDDEDVEDEEVELLLRNIEPLELPKVPQPKPQPQTEPKQGPKDVRKFMMALSAAMEKSQKSQQDIHDWDRKMGLKRSHSKTMRLSTRSRKKLRAMLKKQINALNSKKH
jgi:hypothetical protein